MAYADRVRPLIDRSSRTGRDVATLRAGAVQRPGDGQQGATREGIDRSLEGFAAESADILDQVRSLAPPGSARFAHDLLVGAMAERAAATRDLRKGFTVALGGPQTSAAAVQTLLDVGRDMLAADRLYVQFSRSLPAGDAPPASAWVADEL